MTPEYAGAWRSGYADKRVEMRYAPNGVLRDLNNKSALEVSEAERLETYEARWKIGGSGFLASFNDIMTNKEANDTMAAFVRYKIRQTMKDPGSGSATPTSQRSHRPEPVSLMPGKSSRAMGHPVGGDSVRSITD
jgi:cyclohexanone monooxygenase